MVQAVVDLGNLSEKEFEMCIGGAAKYWNNVMEK